MKKCILCRKSLYQNISFETLFTREYDIHKKCLLYLNKEDTISFPFMDIFVHIHVLFPSPFPNPNKDKIFTQYGMYFFTGLDEGKENRVYILIEDKLKDEDFLLCAKLCKDSLFLLTYTNEDFLLLSED